MKPSPARNVAPEPESWMPIDSLETLPELEDLLDPKLLVESGQTRAIKMGADGRGYIASPKQSLSQRKQRSLQRTIKLKRRARFQRLVFALISIVAVLGASAMYMSNKGSNSAHALNTIPAAVPIYVPVVIEGEKEMRLSVADDLESFIKEQKLSDYAIISPYFSRTNFTAKRSAPALEFNQIKTIQIKVDGKVEEVRTSGLTIQNVLDEIGIVVKGEDIVTPSTDTRAIDVKEISIQRVSTKTRTEIRPIAFITQRQNDSSLAKGKTKEVQRGVNGKEEVTITQTIADGEVIEEKVTGSREIEASKPRIIKVGTKSTSSTARSSGSSNRSQGSESGVASFYDAPGGTCAHKTLPFGTIITVTNTNNGKSTTCRVADRGPFIKGRVIDLSKDRFSAIAPLSSGITNVRLSW